MLCCFGRPPPPPRGGSAGSGQRGGGEPTTAAAAGGAKQALAAPEVTLAPVVTTPPQPCSGSSASAGAPATPPQLDAAPPQPGRDGVEDGVGDEQQVGSPLLSHTLPLVSFFIRPGSTTLAPCPCLPPPPQGQQQPRFVSSGDLFTVPKRVLDNLCLGRDGLYARSVRYSSGSIASLACAGVGALTYYNTSRGCPGMARRGLPAPHPVDGWLMRTAGPGGRGLQQAERKVEGSA